MKQQVKKAALLLLAALLLPVLAACTGASAPPTDGGAQSTAAQTAAPSPVDGIAAADLESCQIVYSQDGVSAEVYLAMAELNSAIKQIFGKKLDMKRDGTETTATEILIGKTNRPESQSVYAEPMRAFDYELRLCGKKLVVASPSDEGLIEALSALKAALPQGGEVFFPSSAQCKYTKDYPLKSLMLGGTDLSAYRIVAGVDAGEGLAQKLAESVRQHCGLILPVVKNAGEGGEHRIYVGNTGATLPQELTNATSIDQYFVGSSGGHIYLYGADTASQVKAVEHLIASIQALTGEAATLDCTQGVILSKSEALTSMSFNLWVSQYSEERAARVVEMINRYKPDTLGVQEANWRWMAKLKSALGEEYAYVGIGRDGGETDEHSAIFYRKDRLELIESDTKWLSDTPDKVSKYEESEYIRIMTYAVFKDRKTEKSFLHINTHLDYKADSVSLKQAKVLMELAAQYPNLPIVISGDFNEKLGSATLGHILQNGMDNSSDVACLTQIKGDADRHNKIIDFIFVSQGKFTVYDYVMDHSEINGGYPSDHSPVIIRYALTGNS